VQTELLVPGADGAGCSIGALGEGLLEVGVDPDLSAESLRRGFGGDAANAVVMAARMGADARLITRVGDDAAGRMLLEFWRAQGIDLFAVSVDASAPTGLYINERDESGGHRFSYHRTGSAASLIDARDARPEALAGLDVLHVTGVSLSISDTAAEAALVAARRARAAGTRISFVVNFRTQLKPDRERMAAFARTADIVFLSVEDARALLGVERIEDVAAALAHPAELVMTHGPEPALLLAGAEQHLLVPPPVLAVDTAGAGDALAGAYLVARCVGVPPRRALAYGVAAGALSCRGSGCARSYPSAAEVTAALSAPDGAEPGEVSA
jgi:2-dehydro-3-deoxygluconokinase